METQTVYIGDEDLNEEAMDQIRSLLKEDETAVAAAGFDFETKVLFVTDQRVLIADAFEGLVLELSRGDIYSARGEGRTLTIRDNIGKLHRHRFGNEQTVRELIDFVNQEKRQAEDTASMGEGSGNEVAQETGWRSRAEDLDESVPIADRVRFWEEQDRINQELIPRVIRQHELLTAHVADHENLPLVASNAISEALAEAREEQRQLYDAALEAAKQDMRQQYDSALDAAKKEHREQYDESLDTAKTAIESEARTNLDRTLSTLNREWHKTRNVLVGISAAAVAIAIIAIVAGVLI